MQKSHFVWLQITASTLNSSALGIALIDGLYLKGVSFSNRLMYRGHNLCCHSTMNKHCYGNIFPLIYSARDREIQGLSFYAWYAVEIA